MPWHLGESSECPSSKPVAVIKDSDGSVAGCHRTKADAEKQLAALYANEGSMNSETIDDGELDERAKYSAEQLREMAANGQAMPDGSYPIADLVDLQNAIRAVGRGSGSHDAIRKHIMKRARALGHADMIPDTWNADGSMMMAASADMPDVVIRSAPFSLTQTDGNTLEGYAAVFDTPTRIHEYGREFDEVIARGAFKRSINAGTPVLMFEHGKHPLYGSMPIGRIHSIKEDSRGLYVKATLHDNWLNEPLRDAINSQAISGMSFRFSVPEGKDTFTQQDNGVALRTIREAKLFELGPVVFPAYTDTTVALRSLEAIVPNVHIVYDMGPELMPSDIPPVTHETREEQPVTTGTSTEPAPVSTSTEPAVNVDPVPDHSTPTTLAYRRQRMRQLILEGNQRNG